MDLLTLGAALTPLSPLPATPEVDVTDYIDVFSARAVHTFGMEFEAPGAGDVDFSSASIFALLGRYQPAPDWTWVPAFQYEASQLDFSTAPFGLAPGAPTLDQGLHRINFPNVLLYTPEGSRWLHGAFLSPGIASDFGDVDSRDFSLSFAAGSGYRFSDALTVGLGVFGSDLTNDPFIIPGAVFFWTPDENWLISYYGPRFVARRNLGEDAAIGFEGAWNGGWWSTDTFGADTRLEVDSFRAGIYYRHRIAGEAWLEIAAGYTFANEIKVYSPGGRDLFPASLGELDPAPYVSVGFSLHRW